MQNPRIHTLIIFMYHYLTVMNYSTFSFRHKQKMNADIIKYLTNLYCDVIGESILYWANIFLFLLGWSTICMEWSHYERTCSTTRTGKILFACYSWMYLLPVIVSLIFYFLNYFNKLFNFHIILPIITLSN